MAGGAPSAKPAPFLKPLDILDRGILLAETSLSFIVVVLMVLAAVAASIARVFGQNAPWAQAADDILLRGTIWAAFLGASFATRNRRHLAIDVAGRLIHDRGRRVIVAVSTALGAVVAACLAYGIYQAIHEQALQAAETVRQNAIAGLTGNVVDHGFEFHYIIPVGFSLIAMRLLLHSAHEFIAAIAWRAPAPVGAKEASHEPDGIPETREPALIFAVEKSERIVAVIVLLIVIGVGAMTSMRVSLAIAAVLSIALVVVPHLRGPGKGFAVHREPVIANPGQIASAFACTAAVVAAAYVFTTMVPSISVGTGVAIFVGMAVLGSPLFTFLGGMALFLWAKGASGVSPMNLAQAAEDVLGNHFATMSVLPTIPVFTLAGYLMSESKTPERLVRVARAWLGWAPGGLAVVCIIASAFFTIFSGASGITIVAIGGLLLPALMKDGYPEKFSLGLVTTGGALGITFPPCLPLIVYGIVAGLQEVPPGHEKLELQKFLVAGLLPGLLLIVMLAVYAWIMGIVAKVPRSKFDAKEAIAALLEAKWEVALPILLFIGFGTRRLDPLSAAALTAFYVLIIEVFVYKDLKLTTDLPRIIPESMVLVGAIFVKLCAATILTFFFVQAETASKLFETLTCGPAAQQYLAAHADSLGTCREAVDALAREGKSAGGLIDSPLTFLIALNVFLLVVGMLMDIFSAIVVIVPLITGIALHFNINPYHLGIVFLINLEIGYLMPPMGLNLFISSFRFNRPVPTLYPVVLPFIGIFIAALLITTYVPSLTLALVPPSHEDVPAQSTPADDSHPTIPSPGDDTTPVPTGNCDEPGPEESFEDFEKRCLGAGAAPSADGTPPTEAPPAAPQGDCGEPGPGESFTDFETRCGKI